MNLKRQVAWYLSIAKRGCSTRATSVLMATLKECAFCSLALSLSSDFLHFYFPSQVLRQAQSWNLPMGFSANSVSPSHPRTTVVTLRLSPVCFLLIPFWPLMSTTSHLCITSFKSWVHSIGVLPEKTPQISVFVFLKLGIEQIKVPFCPSTCRPKINRRSVLAPSSCRWIAFMLFCHSECYGERMSDLGSVTVLVEITTRLWPRCLRFEGDVGIWVRAPGSSHSTEGVRVWVTEEEESMMERNKG